MDFTLRPWRTEDAADIVPHANDPAVSGNLRDVFPYPYTLADAEDYISACVASEGKGQLCRAIVVDGRAAGGTWLLAWPGVLASRDHVRRSEGLVQGGVSESGYRPRLCRALCRQRGFPVRAGKGGVYFGGRSAEERL